MSLTLELSEPTLKLLQAEAEREQRTPEALASELIAEGLVYGREMPGAIEEGSPEEAEAIREGLADLAAGRVRPMEEVHAEIRARFNLPAPKKAGS